MVIYKKEKKKRGCVREVPDKHQVKLKPTPFQQKSILDFPQKKQSSNIVYCRFFSHARGNLVFQIHPGFSAKRGRETWNFTLNAQIHTHTQRGVRIWIHGGAEREGIIVKRCCTPVGVEFSEKEEGEWMEREKGKKKAYKKYMEGRGATIPNC